MIFAGVDEVGRGALFGVVAACAVLLDADRASYLQSLGVKDSKCLSAKRREMLAHRIRSIALDCQIGVATVAEIDSLNILRASGLAMERAIAQLSPPPDHCYIDGNQPIQWQIIPPIPQTTIVKGDQVHPAISCASIVAKVWRDQQMVQLAAIYPVYDLAQNKGYGTAKHRQAIREFGYSDQHRRSFYPSRLFDEDKF
jgi:ribonuclease HII